MSLGIWIVVAGILVVAAVLAWAIRLPVGRERSVCRRGATRTVRAKEDLETKVTDLQMELLASQQAVTALEDRRMELEGQVKQFKASALEDTGDVLQIKHIDAAGQMASAMGFIVQRCGANTYVCSDAVGYANSSIERAKVRLDCLGMDLLARDQEIEQLKTRRGQLFAANNFQREMLRKVHQGLDSILSDTRGDQRPGMLMVRSRVSSLLETIYNQDEERWDQPQETSHNLTSKGA